eukprot:2191906-Prymnesium_polylepis.1
MSGYTTAKFRSTRGGCCHVRDMACQRRSRGQCCRGTSRWASTLWHLARERCATAKVGNRDQERVANMARRNANFSQHYVIP